MALSINFGVPAGPNQQEADNLFVAFNKTQTAVNAIYSAYSDGSGGLAPFPQGVTPTGVTPGSYVTPTITVNQYGQIVTAAGQSSVSPAVVYAGPASGPDDLPTFRTLASSDITAVGGSVVQNQLVSDLGAPIDYQTLADAQAATVPAAKTLVRLASRTAAVSGSGAWYARSVSMPSHPGRWQDATGDWFELAETYPDVRMFGAVGDGIADDIQAFDDCLAYCKAVGARGMQGSGVFAFSRTWDINDLATTVALNRRGYTFDFYNATISALAGFTTGVAGVLGKQPLIGFGRNSSGNLVNLRFRVGYLDGNGRIADGIGNGSGHPTAPLARQNGASQSVFEIGGISDCNIGIRNTATNFGVSDNTWRGGFLSGNNINFLADGPTVVGSAGVPIVEAQYIYFDRVVAGRWGNVVLLRKSRYCDAVADLDLGGQYLSELQVADNANFDHFQNITGQTSGATAEVLAAYTWGGIECVLVMHSSPVVNDGSPFDVGETISNGTNTTTINAIVTANDGVAVPANRFFMDVIAADKTTPFHRTSIKGPWIGGIRGDKLNSLNVFGGNQGANGGENTSIHNDLMGWRLLSSPTQALLYDLTSGTPRLVLESNGDLFAPRLPDVYLGAANARIYNGDAPIMMAQNTWVTILDQTAVGASSFGRCIDLNLWRVADVSTHRAKIQVVLDSAGNMAFTDLGSVGFTFQVTVDNKLQAMQTAFASLSTRRTFLRVG
ncbi:MAG: hypothetical protein ACRC67_07185 [Inquilinus sp.]|uniref:hypothetical protein n=1 Tax=Inquilinus sp. TaxID=1932117 RepID=UPI003F3E008E